MKLKTEIVDGCVHANSVCNDPCDACDKFVVKLEHDAAYAHALGEMVRRYCEQDVLEIILAESAEKMLVWGYR